jgi:glyoxylate carboligase
MSQHKPEYIAMAREIVIGGVQETVEGLQLLIADIESEHIPDLLQPIQEIKDAKAALQRYIDKIQSEVK